VYGRCSARPGYEKGGNTFCDGLVGLDAFRRRADDEVCMFYSGLTELRARHDWCPTTSAWQSMEDVGGRLVGPRPKGVMGSAWARDVPVRRRGRKPGDEEPERRGNASVLSRGFPER